MSAVSRDIGNSNGNGKNCNGNVEDFVDYRHYRCKNKVAALVVDDGGVERFLSATMLRSLGVIAWVACNGREAVDLVAGGEAFNIIFVDRYMPGMNGLETIRMLRAMGFQNKIVGVGSDNEESMEAEERDLMTAGADYYAVKPIGLAQFGALVAEIDAAT